MTQQDPLASSAPQAATAAAPSPAEPVPDEFDLLCEVCNYSLVGLIHSNRCPECGTEFNPMQLPLARVQWLYRRRLGTALAYIQTVAAILKNPTAFGRELCRPVRVSRSDAAAFRHLTLWLAIGGGVAFGVLCMFLNGGWISLLTASIVMFFGSVALISVATTAFVYLATDLPTFIWKGLSDRPYDLAPAHHYACAPFVLVPIASAALIFSCIILQQFQAPWDVLAFAAIAGFIALGIVLLWFWVTAVQMMKGATRCSSVRLLALSLYIPFHYFLIALMCGAFAGAAVYWTNELFF